MSSIDYPTCVHCNGLNKMVKHMVRHYDDGIYDTAEYYLLCKQCNARGPLKPTRQEAVQSYARN